MTKQRNKFLNFWFALIPGCGQMFMGLMKRGVSLMVYFSASLAVTIATNLLVFLVPLIIAWIYSFFDAIILNGLSAERFAEVKDAYIIPSKVGSINDRKVTRYVGIALIIIGIMAIWNRGIDFVINRTNLYEYNNELYNLIYNVREIAPLIVASLFMIIIGIRLIAGKKKEIENQDAHSDNGAV